MVQHFTSYSDIAFDAFAGDKLYPPIGWYFSEIVTVEGSQPPFNGPQLIESYANFQECLLPRTAGEQTFYVNSLGVDLHFTHEQIHLLPMVGNAKMFGFQRAFVVVRVRPCAEFITKRFDDFDQGNLNQVVTAFWSVKEGTNSPSMRERYFPAIDTSDTMEQLAAQNKALKDIGHELLVRYYRFD